MLATANFSTMSNYSASVYSQDSSSDFDSRCSTPSTDSHHRVSIGETQGTDINEERRPSNFSLPFRGLLFPQPPFDEDFDNNKAAFERNSQYEVADIGIALAVPNQALQDTLDAAAQRQKTSHLADTLAALTAASSQREDDDDAEVGPTVAELSPAEPSPIPSPQASTSFSVFPAQNRHHRSSTVSTAIFNPRQDAPSRAGQSPPTSPNTQTPPGFSYESMQTPRCRASTVGLENLRLDLSLIRSALQEDDEDTTTQSSEATPLTPSATKSRVLSFAQARIQRRKSSMMSADGLIPRLISASRKATLVQRRKSSAASSEGLDSDRTSSPASTRSAHWNAEKTTKPAAVAPSSPTQSQGFSFAPAKGFNRHRRQSSEVSPETPSASATTTTLTTTKSRDGSSKPSRRRSSKRSLSWSRAFDKTRSSSSSAKTPPPDQPPPSSLPRSRPSSVPRMSFSRLFDTTTNHHPFTKLQPQEPTPVSLPPRAAEPGPSVLLFSRPYEHHSTTGGIMAVSGSPAAGGSGPRTAGRHRKTVSFSLPSPVAEEPPMSFRRRFASLGSVLGQFEGGSYTPVGADGSGRRTSIGNGVASLFGGGGFSSA